MSAVAVFEGEGGEGWDLDCEARVVGVVAVYEGCWGVGASLRLAVCDVGDKAGVCSLGPWSPGWMYHCRCNDTIEKTDMLPCV